ncbi:DUF3429 domain-containing protein [Gammaproteobacteria bacterium]|nr:DUF3429 domain-containing protein [Gammaproteobacteria bacterium]MDA8982179.1 DUF3429 domain-containing protein [Gammaproteobacteria bacterium]MDA9142959.1 DUF3429 domain-containing protein [Gammaproteobacteria bacterium]MDA9997780.1 DUF3429 domain-containing protein [Gammaproteobacteria bacterium]MDC0367837.1 DUF3429 domain-containing protein [Gammaproteobacteria bacterium]
MNINKIKSTFGYVGFLPFALFAVCPWVFGGNIGITSIYFQLAYGSIILSFLGGMAWGWRDDQPNQAYNLSIGIIYSLVGCLALILIFIDQVLASLLMLMIAFQSYYYFERSTADFKKRDDEYKDFRKMLSLLVSISFLLSSAYWINPYSNLLIN